MHYNFKIMLEIYFLFFFFYHMYIYNTLHKICIHYHHNQTWKNIYSSLSLLYPTTCIIILKIVVKDSPPLPILSYIYIQYYIKFPFIITLEDNDTIPDSSNVPRLHNIQPFTHRLSKFTTNRNVSIIFYQKM